MSKIDELIAELCPEGVRFETLDKVSMVSVGTRPTDQDLVQGGPAPYFNGGVGSNGSVPVPNTSGGTVVIPSRGSVGVVGYSPLDFWCGPLSYRLFSKDVSIMETRYLYFFLKSIQPEVISLQQSGSIPALNKAQLIKIRVPVPPLEVQREIVSILDKFTQLEAELDAELDARRSQYEHTRKQLLDFTGDLSSHPLRELLAELCPEGVEHRQLGSCLLTNIGGGTPSRSVERYWRGDIPWASVGDINASGITMGYPRQSISAEGLASSSSKIVPKGWVVVAVKIAPGAMRVVSAPIAINQDIRGLQLAPILDPHFLTYYFKTISIVSNGTIVQGITSKTLESVQVPVPPLEVQREIVSILDKLDALLNDLTFGLPAEITARRKQYEYYRNQLLTFKELETA